MLTRLRVPRTTVAGHVCNPRVRARVGSWARAAAGAAAARGPEAGPVRRQHAQRRGDRGRQGRGGDPLRHVGEHLGRQRPGRRGRRRGGQGRRRAGRGVRRPLRDRGRRAPGRRAAREPCATRRGSRRRCGRSSSTAASAPSPRTSRTSAACASCPGLAVQRLMADGYGFGGEGDWKTSALLRVLKVAGAGLPGGTSFMEDYTYDLELGQREDPRRAHARGLPDDLRREAAARGAPAGHRRPRGPGPPGVQRRARLRASSSAGRTWATGSAGWPTRSTSSSPPSRCRTCRSPARSGSRGRTSPTATEGWLTAGGPHHTVLTTQLGADELTDLAEVFSTELVLIDADTTRRSLAKELRWSAAYHRLAQRL